MAVRRQTPYRKNAEHGAGDGEQHFGVLVDEDLVDDGLHQLGQRGRHGRRNQHEDQNEDQAADMGTDISPCHALDERIRRGLRNILRIYYAQLSRIRCRYINLLCLFHMTA